ncbi:hypothetical protein [Methylobacterium indicum]|uniref:hypothetical protein n=1 Tax=Methylobacterium indicum TaxID=1775910 RepID=UPI000A3FCE44|nr:hypothetical protein [Methylobacterium indicum]
MTPRKRLSLDRCSAGNEIPEKPRNKPIASFDGNIVLCDDFDVIETFQAVVPETVFVLCGNHLHRLFRMPCSGPAFPVQ